MKENVILIPFHLLKFRKAISEGKITETGKYVDNSFLSGYTKDDRLIPVVTVTLYWGANPWDAPTTLKEMLLEIDEEIDALVDDIDCNLLGLDEEDRKRYEQML